MSVRIESLTKTYGAQNAIDHITFSIGQGEVVGLLGPNGAGKSTTMKILTCFMPQTSGEAEVCNFNTRSNPLEVRRRVGYLPEHNPLYGDMYVKEYLQHVAGMYKLSQSEARVKKMIELTGLGPEQHKRIEQLSKGYRQRVGLAQALVHDPEVLILDEPTSGLDPNQLVEIRNLIRDIGQQKTVILSTHIMQEVEALCPRIIIINKGKIVADGSRESLQKGKKGKELIEIELDGAIELTLIKSLKGVENVEVLAGNRYRIEAQAGHDLRKALFDFAVQQGRAILSLHVQQSSLEDVFRQLTRS